MYQTVEEGINIIWLIGLALNPNVIIIVPKFSNYKDDRRFGYVYKIPFFFKSSRPMDNLAPFRHCAFQPL